MTARFLTIIGFVSVGFYAGISYISQVDETYRFLNEQYSNILNVQDGFEEVQNVTKEIYTSSLKISNLTMGFMKVRN